jgi:hypothetical protein
MYGCLSGSPSSALCRLVYPFTTLAASYQITGLSMILLPTSTASHCPLLSPTSTASHYPLLSPTSTASHYPLLSPPTSFRERRMRALIHAPQHDNLTLVTTDHHPPDHLSYLPISLNSVQPPLPPGPETTSHRCQHSRLPPRRRARISTWAETQRSIRPRRL